MFGKEIADAITPFVMYGAILIGSGGLLYFLYRRWRSGIRAELESDQARHAAEETADALNDLRDARKRGRRAFLRGWMRDRKDS